MEIWGEIWRGVWRKSVEVKRVPDVVYYVESSSYRRKGADSGQDGDAELGAVWCKGKVEQRR